MSIERGHMRVLLHVSFLCAHVIHAMTRNTMNLPRTLNPQISPTDDCTPKQRVINMLDAESLLSFHEWITTLYAPTVAVRASHDVHGVCVANGFTGLYEMLTCAFTAVRNEKSTMELVVQRG